MVTMTDIMTTAQLPYVQFILILIGGLVAASIVHLILKIVFGHITKKTETDLDDLIYHIIIGPLYIIMLAFAAHIAVHKVESIFQGLVWIDNVFFILYVLIVSTVVAKILSLLVTRWLHVQKQHEKAPKLLGKIVAVVVYLIAFLLVLHQLKVEITPFIATLGVGGLAVGLALQGTLSNFFAGLHILSDQPVKVGDFIQIEGSGISGHVDDIGWRSTRIKTLADTIVIVPNAKLADSIIINDSLPHAPVEVNVKCGVSYESDLEHVEQVTMDVARKMQKEHRLGVRDFEPSVRYSNFGDSNIEFNVWLKVTDFAKKGILIHDFMKALKQTYDKENIEMSYPVRKIYNAK